MGGRPAGAEAAAMRRPLILAAMLAVALPAAAADAAIIPTVSAGTLSVTGDGAADQITVRATSPTTVQVNDLSFDRATFSRIEIRSGGGDDTVRIADALSETVTVETGAGADAVAGGPGAETIATGDDADVVHAGGGDDAIVLGAGDDTAIQAEGVDAVDGQSGTDTLRAIGSAESEELTLTAVGAQARVARDTVVATTDSAGVEVLDVTAAGGPDLVDVGDLGPTDVQTVEADLGVLDGAGDEVAVQGSQSTDLVGMSLSGEGVVVHGLPGIGLRVEHSRPADDRLTVRTSGGSDVISAGRDVGSRIGLQLEGGEGADTITGSDAADVLRGGPGIDVVTGGRGADIADLGDGDDLFARDQQAGDDRVNGGAGVDITTMLTTDADEVVEVTASGPRVRVTSPSSGSLDLDGLDRVRVQPLGGRDEVVVRDLAGTATTQVDVDLSVADLKLDTLTVVGSDGPDTLRASTTGTTHAVTGLGAAVHLVNPERGEKLAIQGRDGADQLLATALERDRLQPFLDGGLGKDTLGGSPGQDVVAGGQGDDFAFMGGGVDTFTWVPGDGDDIVDGQAGTDFLRMSGSGAAERFDVTALGTRTRLTRDISNVLIDLGGVERLDVNPAGGADTVYTGDLSGTYTKLVAWELAPFRGTTATDGARDTVLMDGTFGDDSISVTAAGHQVRATGLAAVVEINRSDPGLDLLHIDTKLGNDVVGVLPRARELMTITTL